MNRSTGARSAIWLVQSEAGQPGFLQHELPSNLFNEIKNIPLPVALKLLAGNVRPRLIFLEGRPGKAAQRTLTQLKNLQPKVPVFLVTRWDSAGQMQTWLSQNFMELVRAPAPALLEPANAYRLSGRELDILRLMVKGLIKKEIAEQLKISYHTVDNHERNIFKKMNIHTRSGAVAKALIEKIC